ncbi:hypothetical protein ONE63_002305 [Megalurothrips usitatus]|uniref:Protein jim lovell n=1 Tax=Megalurothrips usitatus TaxID=439358 RepID=A0AAV7XC89_9NEOP|nr:hypothetical protein ONE63_002305 [Megalurothrips usitatus]
MAGSAGSSGSPHYSLRWNNHQSHILHAFDTLLQSEALVDVTLVCEDTRRVRAHKVVLSACSPFFEKIFAETPCKHPVIVLKDIRSWELQGIVDFMYKGEISVVEEQLSSLIKAAESLQVRGLSHPDQVPAQARGGGGGSGGGHGGGLGVHLGRSQSPPQVCMEKFPHYPVHDAMSPHNGPGASSPYPPSPSDRDPRDCRDPRDPRDRDLRLGSPLRLPTIPHMPSISFTDGPLTPVGDRFCASPQPRRKQARPRRRSGESGAGGASASALAGVGPAAGAQPQDLSKATSSPTADRPDRLDRLDVADLSVKRSRPSSVGLPSSGDRGDRSGHPSRQTTPVPSATPNTMPSLKHESEESGDCLDMSNPERRDFPNHVSDHPHPGLLLRDSPLDNSGFPNIPSLAAMAMTTPQHVFPLDSQLGLFPGMEPHHRNPLLNDLPESRGENHHIPSQLPNPNSGPNPGTTPGGKRSKSKWQDGKCRPKGQHSAPRGGPPRSWTNAELTEALQHVWNKKMTTSQASRIFGIPYNSLLMYVRGKYGKSLKLEQLRKDCQGGPVGPLDLLGLPQLGHNNNQITAKDASQHLERLERIERMDRELDRDVPAMPESDLIMGPNFPYSGNFYPDFPGFPLPVGMVHLLPQSEKNRLNQAVPVNAQLPLALDFASFRGDKDLDRDREHDDRDRESERDRKRERKVAQAHQVILRERERELQQQQREMLQREQRREQDHHQREREREQILRERERERDRDSRDPPSSPRSSQSTPQPPAAPVTPPSPAQENNNTNTDKLLKTQDLISFRACGVQGMQGIQGMQGMELASPKGEPMTPVPTPPLAHTPLPISSQPELVVEFNGQE